MDETPKFQLKDYIRTAIQIGRVSDRTYYDVVEACRKLPDNLVHDLFRIYQEFPCTLPRNPTLMELMRELSLGIAHPDSSASWMRKVVENDDVLLFRHSLPPDFSLNDESLVYGGPCDNILELVLDCKFINPISKVLLGNAVLWNSRRWVRRMMDEGEAHVEAYPAAFARFDFSLVLWLFLHHKAVGPCSANGLVGETVRLRSAVGTMSLAVLGPDLRRVQEVVGWDLLYDHVIAQLGPLVRKSCEDAMRYAETPEMVQRLKAAGFRAIRLTGDPPLFRWVSNEEMVALLSAGASINEPREDHSTLWDVSIQTKNWRLLRFCLENGLLPDHDDAWQLVCKWVKEGDADSIRGLLLAGYEAPWLTLEGRMDRPDWAEDPRREGPVRWFRNCVAALLEQFREDDSAGLRAWYENGRRYGARP